MALTLNESGTVVFDLEAKDAEGKPYSMSIQLRRPTLGEYRDVLREPLDEIMDKANDALDEITVMQEAAEGESVADQKKRIPDARALRRRVARELDDLRIGWFFTVMKTLGPVDLDYDQIDAPVWALDPDLAPELVGHWRTRPGPPSGGQ